jgi:ATP-dependent DNA ligase
MSLMRRRQPCHFYAFDLIRLNGEDLRDRLLIKRKRVLRRIIPPQPAHVVYVDHIERRAIELFRFVWESDLEGIVAKRRDGLYVSKGAAAWVKIKNRNYSQARGRREMFEGFRSSRANVSTHVSP